VLDHGVGWDSMEGNETERKGRDAHYNIKYQTPRRGYSLSRGLLIVDYYCRWSSGAAASSNGSCTAVGIIGVTMENVIHARLCK